MANVRRTIKLHISAFPDGASYIVTIEEPATGREQVIEGVVAASEDEAIERVTALLERNAQRAMGPTAYMADAHTPIGQIYQRAVDAGASFISIEAACGHRALVAMSAGADHVKLMLARVSMLPCANCQVEAWR